MECQCKARFFQRHILLIPIEELDDFDARVKKSKELWNISDDAWSRDEAASYIMDLWEDYECYQVESSKNWYQWKRLQI